MAALNSLDELGQKAAPVRDQIAALPDSSDDAPSRMKNYVKNLLGKIESNFASE